MDKQFRLAFASTRSTRVSKVIERLWNGTVVVYDSVEQARSALDELLELCETVTVGTQGQVFGVVTLIDTEVASIISTKLICSPKPIGA